MVTSDGDPHLINFLVEKMKLKRKDKSENTCQHILKLIVWCEE